MFQITDVKVALNEGNTGKLRAFVTMTLDDAFVVRDIKVIDGKKGLFVAMPCSQITVKCTNCGKRNTVHSRYCSSCGKHLPDHLGASPDTRREEYRDIAHPICTECRDYIEQAVIKAYIKKDENAHLTFSA